MDRSDTGRSVFTRTAVVAVTMVTSLGLLVSAQAFASDSGAEIGDPATPPPPPSSPPSWSDADQVPIVDRNGNIRVDSEGREITVSEEQLNLWPDAPPVLTDDPDGLERVVVMEVNEDGQEETVERVYMPPRLGVVK